MTAVDPRLESTPKASPDRLDQLQQWAQALAACVEPAQVARVLNDEAPAVLGAYSAVLHTLAPSGDMLEHLAISEAAMRAHQRVRLDEPLPLTQVFKSARALWLPDPEAAASYPALQRYLGERRAWCMLPLTVRGRTTGVFSLAFSAPQPFDERQRALLEAAAGNAALALEHVRLLEHARRHAARLATLQRITEGLSRTSSLTEMGPVLTAPLVEEMGAATCGIFAADQESGVLRQVTLFAAPDDVRARVANVPLDEQNLMGRAACRREALYLRDHVEMIDAFPHLAAGARWEAHAAIPLVQDGELLGIFALAFERAQPFPADERSFLESVGRQCAQAIQRARLFASLQQRLDERTRAENELRRITDALPVMVGFVDAQGRFGWVNRPYERWFRREPGSMVGRTVREVSGEHIWPKIQQHVQRALNGEPVSFEHTLHPSVTGQQETLEVHYIPRLESDGSCSGFLTVIADVSREHDARTERERLLAESRTAVNARDVFLAMAGHELRTPLTAVQLHVDAANQLLRKNESERAADRIQRARAGITRLAGLVDDLLDVSRISANSLVVRRSPVRLDDVIRATVALHSEEAARSGSPISVEAEPVEGDWDALRMEQVVTNLLGNALKYGRGRPVHITLRRDGADAVLSVRDEGIGIAQGDQDRIFGRFERAVDSPGLSGMGLGLWIVREVVEAHGGRISLTSVPDQGSTFIVTLPLR